MSLVHSLLVCVQVAEAPGSAGAAQRTLLGSTGSQLVVLAAADGVLQVRSSSSSRSAYSFAVCHTKQETHNFVDTLHNSQAPQGLIALTHLLVTGSASLRGHPVILPS